eukprot:gene10491-14088_t
MTGDFGKPRPALVDQKVGRLALGILVAQADFAAHGRELGLDEVKARLAEKRPAGFDVLAILGSPARCRPIDRRARDGVWRLVLASQREPMDRSSPIAAMTLVEKVIARAAGRASVRPGEILTARVDFARPGRCAASRTS